VTIKTPVQETGVHDGVRHARTSGSTNCVGRRFRYFRINGLEMVDQKIVSWNPVMSWLRKVEALRRAA
jgi:hypothetical protein